MKSISASTSVIKIPTKVSTSESKEDGNNSVKADTQKKADPKYKQDIGELEEKRAELEKEIKEKEQKIKEQRLLDGKAVQKIKEERKAYLAKPAVIFIGGLDLSSGVSGGMYDGMRLMANSQHGAKHFNWNEKSEIINEIEKHRNGYPVILIGHSFGADTAVEIAEELNTLERGFKNINLLVTVDAIGNKNDIIPQNVKENLNIISSDTVLSDAPNIARNAQKTDVRNVLRNEGHTALDDSSEVQADILQAIQNSIYKSKMTSINIKA